VQLNARGPEWLHDLDACRAACARERRLYEEIGRPAPLLSDAREQAKIELLARLSREHGVVLVFDSVLITHHTVRP